VYGLRPAGRRWHIKTSKKLEEKGFSQSAVDGGIFFRREQDGSTTIVLLYVDDGLVLSRRGAKALAKEILDAFGKDGGTLGEYEPGKTPFEYVGLTIDYDPAAGTASFSQQQMITDLYERFSRPRQTKTPVNEVHTPGEKLMRSGKKKRWKSRVKTALPSYREGVGSVGYIAQSSRPDCSFSHTELSRHLEEAEPPTDLLLRTIGYLERTKEIKLVFERTPGPARNFSEMLQGWSDSDWRSPRSTSGYMLTYGGLAFLWKSITQKSTALSTAEAETVSLCAEAKCLKGFANLIFEIFHEELNGIKSFLDNLSAVQINAQHYTSMRCRHYDLQFHFCRQQVICGMMNLLHVSDSEMKADGLTKPVPLRKLLLLFSNKLFSKRVTLSLP
jgi:hypothetical protein